MYTDTRTFSEYNAFSSMAARDRMYAQILSDSSVSTEDAMQRNMVYGGVMENYDNLKEQYKTFSGYTEIPLLSNQYFNATMASYIRSFAGYLAIERKMDQPTQLAWYNDLLGVVDNRIVLPNIGQENLEGINARFQASSTMDPAGTGDYEISTNKKLIPGSVELRLIKADGSKPPILIKDDRAGNLLAPAGVLKPLATPTELSVNYAKGVVKFSIGAGFTVAAGDTYTLSGFEDVAGDPAFGSLNGPGNNRFKIDMKNIMLTAEPDMLVGENNLMAMAAAKKAIGFDPQEATGAKLTELYTKLINEKLVREIMDNDMGNEVVINMTEYINKFTDYNSRLDAFQSDLVEVDTKLAIKTRKAVKATAYVVGEGVSNTFRKLRNTGNWVDNKESTYVNDLQGFFNGIPVLRSLLVGMNEGYATYKDPTGSVAPVMRGLYLPLTNTPIVGSYNNPTQFAQGIYYQETNRSLFPELSQKFVLKFD